MRRREFLPALAAAAAAGQTAVQRKGRLSSTSPARAGWPQVLPWIAGTRASLGELIGGFLDQRQITFFRHDDQQVLIGQQNHLAVTIPSALPVASSVFDINAREDAAAESKCMPVVDDSVVKAGRQSARSPALPFSRQPVYG